MSDGMSAGLEIGVMAGLEIGSSSLRSRAIGQGGRMFSAAKGLGMDFGANPRGAAGALESKFITHHKRVAQLKYDIEKPFKAASKRADTFAKKFANFSSRYAPHNLFSIDRRKARKQLGLAQRAKDKLIDKHVAKVLKTSVASEPKIPYRRQTKFDNAAKRLGMSTGELMSFRTSQVLKFGSRAMMGLFNIQLGMALGEGIVHGANAIAELGETARSSGVGASESKYYTGGIAATMRQASLSAMQASQTGTRPFLGQEARAFHG